MSLSPERKGRLTASTFGAAIGISKYQSRQALYRQIKGIDEPFEGNEATEYGKKNEPNAVNAYECIKGNIVTKSGDNQEFFIHTDIGWLGCTPDGFCQDGDIVRLVEFKCPFNRMYDDIPEYYMPQIQGQMAITGLEECDFVAWSPEEVKIWRVQFSEEYWQVMIPLLEDFWQCVQNDVEPKRRKRPVMPQVDYIELI